MCDEPGPTLTCREGLVQVRLRTITAGHLEQTERHRSLHDLAPSVSLAPACARCARHHALRVVADELPRQAADAPSQADFAARLDRDHRF